MIYAYVNPDTSPFILDLLYSATVTLLMYSIFPIFFALLRKNPITTKKYRGLCYGLNAAIGSLVMLIIAGRAPTPAPYLLWTYVFSGCGKKILSARGIIPENLQVATELSQRYANTAKDRFCHKCGKPLKDGSRFCAKCGTAIDEDASTLPISKPGNATKSGTVWVCCYCHSKNLDNRTTCWSCGQQKKVSK